MPANHLHFTEKNENAFLYRAASTDDSAPSNNRDLRRKASFIMRAMEVDLTNLQRYCVTEHWLNGRKQKDIAAELGVNCSTVSRHLKAAKKKMVSATRYCK